MLVPQDRQRARRATEVSVSRRERPSPRSGTAEDKPHTLDAVNAFDAAHGAKFPRRPIESTFSTVRHRMKVTKGPGSRAADPAMAFKLIESAQAHWRTVNFQVLVCWNVTSCWCRNWRSRSRPTRTTLAGFLAR